MKYRQGGEIKVGDYVVEKVSSAMGRVQEINDRCGTLKIWHGGYYLGDVEVGFTTITRPKSIRPAEPEELI